MTSIKNLEILDTGKTVVFTSPLSGYDNYLVRTGIIQENNSFIHSVLTAYSKEYFYMDIKGKKQLVEEFMENIFTIKQFKKDITNYRNYKSKLLKFIKDIYNIKEELQDKKLRKIHKHISKNPVYELFFEIVLIDDIEKMFNINDDVNDLKPDNNNMIDQYKNIINHEIKNYLESLEILNHIKDKTKLEFIKKNITNIVNLILDNIELYQFDVYIKDITKDINIDMVNIISNKLKTDIYFIDSKTRLPYKYNTSQIYNNKKAIIILKIENSYETIGLLLDDNKVKRDFDFNHFLIKKINTFLFETDKIPSKYPELLNYIKYPPKPLLKNKKHIVEDSDEDSDISFEKDDKEDSEEDSEEDGHKDNNEDSSDNNSDI
jgi:hypothetical protein